MNICKESNCNFAYPILATECIGNSLSAINYNFGALDAEICQTENTLNNDWTPTYTYYASISAKMASMMTTVASLSSMWQQTYSTVSEMSAFYLTPISVVYPWPIPTGSNTSLTTITNWANSALPAKAGNCINYIVGQQLYVHVAENTSVLRSKVQRAYRAGVNQLTIAQVEPYQLEYFYSLGNYTFNYVYHWCPGYDIYFSASLDDQFIEKFVGVRLTLNSNFVWGSATIMF